MRYRIVKQGNKDYVGLEKPWWSFRWRIIKYWDGYGKKVKMRSSSLKDIKTKIVSYAHWKSDPWNSRFDIEYLDYYYMTIIFDC